MKKILFEVVNNLKNTNYLIAKLPNKFPSIFKTGSDLDIFCENIAEVINSLYPVINKYIESYQNVKVKIYNFSKNHSQIDFCLKENLLFKLDICDKIENFKNYKVSNNFLKKILKNKKKKIIKFNSKKATVFIPRNKDEIFIRYMEYIKSNKKKKQHQSYFLKYNQNQKMKKSFESYLSKKKLDLDLFFDIIKKYQSQANYYKYKIKKHSVAEIFSLMKKKFKRG